MINDDEAEFLLRGSRKQLAKINKVQILTIKDCKRPQTNMPKDVGSIKT